MSIQETYYSWIPNLSSRINFDYISDELEFENNKVSIEQKNDTDLGKNEKKFILRLNSSDRFTDRGHYYKVTITLKLEEDKSISGEYKEEILAQKANTDHVQYLSASFCIQENGFISIFDLQWDVSAKTDTTGYKNKHVNIYNNIKLVLHKDVHHDTKEDVELNLYSEENYKDLVLDRLFMSIKAFERQIKDESHPIQKLDYLEKKLYQASGYNAYLRTYTVILERTDAKYKDIKREYLELADNIIVSAKYLIEQYKTRRKEKEALSLIVGSFMTLFVPVLIAFSKFINTNNIVFFEESSDLFLAAFAYTAITLIAMYYYSSRKIAFLIYRFISQKRSFLFMKARNYFSDNGSFLSIISLLLAAMLLFNGFILIYFSHKI